MSWLNDVHDKLSAQNNKRPLGRLNLALGELYLKLTSDLDPSFPFLYWKNLEIPRQTISEGTKMAEKHLKAAASLGQEASMPGISAHALHTLATLKSRDNHFEEAKSLVLQAQELSAPLDWTTLNQKLATHQPTRRTP